MAGRARRKVLAVASAGGHWQQLLRILAPLDQLDVHYLTTLAGLPEQAGITRAGIVPDCNRNRPLRSLVSAAAILSVVLRHRPDVVISTGALPGVIALACGKLIGARTIWVDSVANAEEMSMSGRQARRFADLWLTQWEHVARQTGAEYAGSVL